MLNAFVPQSIHDEPGTEAHGLERGYDRPLTLQCSASDFRLAHRLAERFRVSPFISENYLKTTSTFQSVSKNGKSDGCRSIQLS
jgi:hypothetical protein